MTRSMRAIVFILTSLAAVGSTSAASVLAAEMFDAAALSRGLSSIQREDLRRHVLVLADDTYEGREAGSRGGRAAGGYLHNKFQEFKLAPAGARGSYYQTFNNGFRNVLGMIEGSDPAFKNEVILVGAHYDHVGYGTLQNSFGPTGRIHNGADDNASGTATLVELVEAFVAMGAPPRRTILFALWDGEEKGLLGSKHWLSAPTIPVSRIKLAANLDMVGRLRNRLEVLGTRTTYDLRRKVSLANRDVGLKLDFTWELKEDSDHWSFYERGMPILMFHTGLHDQYHRPSDDVEHIEFDGMRQITELLFRTVVEVANEEQVPGFRSYARRESSFDRRRIEQPLSTLPPRLGARMQVEPAGSITISGVEPGSAAARTGLLAGDRLIRLGGAEVTDLPSVRKRIWAAINPLEIEVLRGDATEPTRLSVTLDGAPVRVGLTWRGDDATPGGVILSRVIAGTAASEAGLKVNDRIYAVNGQSFHGQEEFLQLLKTAGDEVELVFERQGMVGTARLMLLREPPEAPLTMLPRAHSRALAGENKGN
ncbi:MAG: M20/M25/M40 family metallo-hydrolase [Pirellulales bacterium]|nr:M20/M25/M40 family metallo-hydrolase [Pirellulales bacterium]